MSVFSCKMCGGKLSFEDGASIAICEYCGTKQTLPRLDDEKRSNLYDRASHFRRANEFDKAMGIYEQLLVEDGTDAEAYWSLVLCRYGIEYVEDPASRKRVPTINRAQFASVLADEDYKSALKYADSSQRAIYEDEAHVIDEIQKGILVISQREEPFDVFICYKETDANGRRTPDSVLAQELYYQLKEEGYKVFFSRITLEDKLGSAYEPYIFAALNSSKVMVVLGTKAEHFNAVWVKNEWSRYLALIKNGAKKMLIPAYRDMDPYDLPEEFSHLQAQDMSKLGFMQDLIRGIKKIVRRDESRSSVAKETAASSVAPHIAPLLERISMFLEDGDFDSADEYCEKVLDQDPKNGEAYLGKLMVELRVKKRADLAAQKAPFDDRNSYQKILRFGDAQLIDEVKGYIRSITDRIENERLNGLYAVALGSMEAAKTQEAFAKAAELFREISQYKDAAAMAEQCTESAERCRKDQIYETARAKMSRNDISAYEEAAKLFATIPDWRDANEQQEHCYGRTEEIKATIERERIEREQERERREKERLEGLYLTALNAMNSASTPTQYERAAERFKGIEKYRDSAELVKKCLSGADACRKNAVYKTAFEKTSKGSIAAYEEAIKLFETIPDWQDAPAQIERCRAGIEGIRQQKALREEERAQMAEQARREKAERRSAQTRASAKKKLLLIGMPIVCLLLVAAILIAVFLPTYFTYQNAITAYNEGKYREAYELFAEVENYSNSSERMLDSRYREAIALYEKGDFEQAYDVFALIPTYENAAEYMQRCKYRMASALYEKGKYDEAYDIYASIKSYNDAATMMEKCQYQKASALYKSGKYDEAYDVYKLVSSYKDSAAMMNACIYQKANALYEKGKYDEAYAVYLTIYNYKNSADMMKSCRYQKAISLYEQEKFSEAETIFKSLGSYKSTATYLANIERQYQYEEAETLYKQGKLKDAYIILKSLTSSEAKVLLETVKEAIYQKGLNLYNDGKLDEAYELLGVIPSTYKTTSTVRSDIETERTYQGAIALMAKNKYDEAYEEFSRISSYKDSATKKKECRYQKAMTLFNSKNYDAAYTIFSEISSYSNAAEMMKECRYQKAMTLFNSKNYEVAYTIFSEISSYSNSAEMMKECRYQKALVLKAADDFGGAYQILKNLNYKDSASIIENYYQEACALYSNGETLAAYRVFLDIPDYKDVPTKMTNIQKAEESKATAGLKFTLNSSTDTYSVSGYEGTTKRVVIPGIHEGKLVTEVGYRAFVNCDKITSVTIPNSVTSIGSAAFNYCSGLTSITIPNSVTSIGSYAFYSCDSLISITIPDGVTSIGSGVFEYCQKLMSITIPNGVTSIGDYAFFGCRNLTSITIPDGVTSIGERAFGRCSGLTSITIPKNVTNIGAGAFSECSESISITVALGNANYHVSRNCLIETKSKTLIAGCQNSVIPTDGSVTSIGENAFAYCSNLTSITIPNNVTSIGRAAFFGCHGLTSITIPDSVTSIGHAAFGWCRGLTRIVVEPDNLNYHSAGNCLIETKSKTLIAGFKNSTIPADGSVTSIGLQAFRVCYGLTSITIPDSVTSIGNSAFSACTNLTNVTIPSSVTSIDDDAFGSCSKLTSITFTGTRAEWNNIQKNSSWWMQNSPITAIHCTDGTITIG